LKATKKKTTALSTQRDTTGKLSILPGVLSTKQIIELSKSGHILGIPDSYVQKYDNESALDLHLGNVIYSMKGSYKGTNEAPYLPILQKFGNIESLNTTGIKLETGKTYVIPLMESIKLAKSTALYGIATGKSSIGRLDVLCRLISDYSNSYDQLPDVEAHKRFDDNIEINLYVEITPLTFAIKVYPGISMNQIRLFKGKPEYSEIDKSALVLFGEDLMVNNQGGRMRYSGNLSLNIEMASIAHRIEAPAYKSIRKRRNDTR